MADNGDPLEWIVFLARSEARVDVLEYLTEHGETTQSDVAAEIAVSERTITRTFNQFVDRGWVETESRSYRLTSVGELVAREFLSLTGSFQEIEALSPFCRWFPTAAYDLDISKLLGAEVTAHSESEPYAPARAQSQLLERTNTYRALLPSVDLEGTEVAYEEMKAGRLETELIVPPRIKETMGNHEYTPLLREHIAAGRLVLRVAEHVPEFHLGLADDGIVQIGVEDDSGLPRALVETTDPDVRSWGEEIYSEYRAQSTTVPETELC